MNAQALRRRLLGSMLFGVLVFGGLLAYGDASQVGSELGDFRWELTPIILVIALFNYVLRFLKWQYYLGKVGVRNVPAWDSFLVYMSGLGMTVTPGKIGEWLKCYLLREMHGTPATRTTPILIAERLTDALALLALSIAGIIAFENGAWPIVAVVILLSAIAVTFSRHRGASGRIVSAARRLPIVGRFAPEVDEMQESNYLLMDPVGVVLMTALSTVAWLAQVVAFYIVLLGFGVDAGPDTFMKASFILPISTLAAGILLVPGGLGVAETGIATLCVNLLDMSRSTATAATLVIRLATLWFAVALGLIAFAVVMRRLPAVVVDDGEDVDRADPRLVATSDPAG